MTDPNPCSISTPPYFGGENDYGKGMFDRSQFEVMGEALAEIEGAFVLSINDTPEIRDVFGQFHLEEVQLKYTISAQSAKVARELLVSNREIVTGLI